MPANEICACGHIRANHVTEFCLYEGCPCKTFQSMPANVASLKPSQSPDEGVEEWSKRKLPHLQECTADTELVALEKAEKLALAKFTWSAALAWKGER